MAGAYRNCPQCGTPFQYAVEHVKGEWVELEEPWECTKCNSLIVIDSEKPGLKVVEKERAMDIKGCPILMSRSDMPTQSFWEDSGCAEGILEARVEWYKQNVGCQKDKCEWYGHGCPAHPVVE